MRRGLMRGRSLHTPWPSSTSPPGSKVCTDSQMPVLLVPPGSKACSDSQMPFLLDLPRLKGVHCLTDALFACMQLSVDELSCWRSCSMPKISDLLLLRGKCFNRQHHGVVCLLHM